MFQRGANHLKPRGSMAIELGALSWGDRSPYADTEDSRPSQHSPLRSADRASTPATTNAADAATSPDARGRATSAVFDNPLVTRGLTARMRSEREGGASEPSTAGRESIAIELGALSWGDTSSGADTGSSGLSQHNPLRSVREGGVSMGASEPSTVGRESIAIELDALSWGDTSPGSGADAGSSGLTQHDPLRSP